MPIPFPEPDQSPEPLLLGGSVCTAIATTPLSQEEQMARGIKQLCRWQDCLAQEAGKAEEEWERMCGQVHDLMDQRSDLQGEIYQLEQEPKRMKEELAQFKTRKKELEASGLSLTQIILSSVSGLSRCFSWAKHIK